jgi:hypothetical protein
MTILATAALISVGVSLFVVIGLVVMCVVIAILDTANRYAGKKRVARIIKGGNRL